MFFYLMSIIENTIQFIEENNTKVITPADSDDKTSGAAGAAARAANQTGNRGKSRTRRGRTRTRNSGRTEGDIRRTIHQRGG